MTVGIAYRNVVVVEVSGYLQLKVPEDDAGGQGGAS